MLMFLGKYSMLYAYKALFISLFKNGFPNKFMIFSGQIFWGRKVIRFPITECGGSFPVPTPNEEKGMRVLHV